MENYASYQTNSKLSRNEWITDPTENDPENLPEPLGWNLIVRPYPVKNTIGTKSTLYIPDESIDYLNGLVNIGRVVKLGPCCYNKPEHLINGEQVPWVQPGDFISWPRNVGAKRKFKGISFILLSDDEVVERLTDPKVFNEGSFEMDIPQEHLEKYNTIYNPNFKGF